MILEFNVGKNILKKRENPKVINQNANYYKCVFHFAKEIWENKNIFVYFSLFYRIFARKTLSAQPRNICPREVFENRSRPPPRKPWWKRSPQCPKLPDASGFPPR